MQTSLSSSGSVSDTTSVFWEALVYRFSLALMRLSLDHVRLLGVTTAADLGLDMYLANVCKTCSFWFRRVRRIRRSLDVESIKTGSFVCKKVTDKLQRVQNAAAHLITGTQKHKRGLSRLLRDDYTGCRFHSGCSTSLL